MLRLSGKAREDSGTCGHAQTWPRSSPDPSATPASSVPPSSGPAHPVSGLTRGWQLVNQTLVLCTLTWLLTGSLYSCVTHFLASGASLEGEAARVLDGNLVPPSTLTPLGEVPQHPSSLQETPCFVSPALQEMEVEEGEGVPAAGQGPRPSGRSAGRGLGWGWGWWEPRRGPPAEGGLEWSPLAMGPGGVELGRAGWEMGS